MTRDETRIARDVPKQATRLPLQLSPGSTTG